MFDGGVVRRRRATARSLAAVPAVRRGPAAVGPARDLAPDGRGRRRRPRPESSARRCPAASRLPSDPDEEIYRALETGLRRLRPQERVPVGGARPVRRDRLRAGRRDRRGRPRRGPRGRRLDAVPALLGALARRRRRPRASASALDYRVQPIGADGRRVRGRDGARRGRRGEPAGPRARRHPHGAVQLRGSPRPRDRQQVRARRRLLDDLRRRRRRLRAAQGRRQVARVGARALAQHHARRRRRDPADPGELDHQAAVGRAAAGPGGPGLAAAATTCSTWCSTPTSSTPRAARSCSPRGFDPEVVDRVLSLVDRAEWKRRQYPLGTRRSPRSPSGATGACPITTRWREPIATAVHHPRPGAVMTQSPGAAATRHARHRRCPAGAPAQRVRVHHLREAKERGERLTMLTAYDYPTARIFDDAGIDLLLVGDSIGNTMLGQDTHHPGHRRRADPGGPRGLRGGPAGAGRRRPAVRVLRGVRRAGVRDGRADAQGGRRPRGEVRGRPAASSPQVRLLTDAGIPVVGHLGFTPQSENLLGGKRVQGRGDEAAERLVADAARAAGGGRDRRRPGDGPGAARRAGSPRCSRSRRSASARAPAATGRCSSGSTWPAWATGRRGSPSSSRRSARRWATPPRLRRRGALGHLPGRRALVPRVGPGRQRATAGARPRGPTPRCGRRPCASAASASPRVAYGPMRSFHELR